MDNEVKTKIINFELGNINTFPIIRYNCAEYDNSGDDYNHIIDNVYIGNILSLDDKRFIAELDQIISLVKLSQTSVDNETYQFYSHTF